MRRFGLIGRKLSHSFSAKYFAEKFERESLSDECRYDLFEMEDISSDEARNIGAVNCVKLLSDGSRIGYNTDVDGVRVSLDKLLGVDEIESALVLGTGGASQAVQYVLAERGISFSLVSRDATKGNIIYDDITPDIIAANRLIINTTPIGMYPHIDQAPDIPYEELTTNHYLFDLVYNPERTLFLERGAVRGAHTLSGLDMLYAQAESAWKIWNE